MSEECTHDCSTCSAACSSREAAPQHDAPNPNSSVKKVIGVVSGKGGVGKSMTSALLACAMARRGYHCGILDADITGPSIPKLFGIHGRAMADEKGCWPIQSRMGIDVMSINLLVENEEDPVVWRGPVIAGAVKQCLQDRAGGGKQPILACGGGEFREPGTEHETAMLVAQYEAMAFKRNGQAVRGRTGETRGTYQLPQGGRARFEGVEDFYGLVKHPNAGMDFIVLRSGGKCLIRGGEFAVLRCDIVLSSSHNTVIMPSHIVKWQIRKYLIVRPCGACLNIRPHNGRYVIRTIG